MSSRRIPDPGSLIAGIAFAGIGLIFLVGDVELADRARWMWPIVLVGLGAGLLAVVLRRPADGPVASKARTETATFPPAEPSTQAPWAEPEPGAAAGSPYEPPGESRPDAAPEGGWPETGLVDDSLAEPGPAEGNAPEPDLPGASAAEPDAAEDSAPGDAPEGRERS
jgi:hypothetical protein